MTVPTEPDDQQPHAAVIEIVDRHSGEKYPYAGASSILFPNHLRIDGLPIWATVDEPATIEAIVIDGGSDAPFAVTLSLLARAVSVGGESAFSSRFTVGDTIHGAVVEVPGVDVLVPGQELDRPYVLLNGRMLYTAGRIQVGKFAVGGDWPGAAMVTLTLLCRRLLIDDEPGL